MAAAILKLIKFFCMLILDAVTSEAQKSGVKHLNDSPTLHLKFTGERGSLGESGQAQCGTL